MTVKITVDCMGGDHGPAVTVIAAASFIRQCSDAELLLVGLPEAIDAQLKRAGLQQEKRLSVIAATEVVAMDDPVEVALRKKKNSSMRVALDLVKDGAAQACVSAGNTGALMAVSRHVLKTLTGIDRPAIATVIPNRRGWTTILDLGANVDCEPAHLLQFAEMGNALVCAIDGKERPTIGLLNIGEEIIKGNETIKRAGELLRASSLNFFGNIEGDDIFKGTTDIVVCDGFTGNVVLKATEGLVQLLGATIKEEFNRTLLSRLMGLGASLVLARFKRRFDHRRYNGAALLGLRGLVFKSHGSADVYAFECAIKRAYDAVKNGVQERLTERLKQTFPPADESAVSATNAEWNTTSPPSSPVPQSQQKSRQDSVYMACADRKAQEKPYTSADYAAAPLKS